MLKKGKHFPEFSLKNQNGTFTTLDDLKDHWSVVYFYMKDYSDICTNLAKEFTALSRKFKAKNTHVYGVSRDSVRSHLNVFTKHKLFQTLLSDPDHVLMEACGIWGPKMVHGKELMGAHRTTFILDPETKVREIFTNVVPLNHPANVYEALAEIQAPHKDKDGHGDAHKGSQGGSHKDLEDK
jgi:peroxiredoxin Q/BCP